MKIDYLKEKKELVSVALLGGSVLLAVVMLWKVTRFFEVSARAQNVVTNAIQNNAQEPDAEQYLRQDREIISALSGGNLFVPAIPPENPVSEVRAIFGDSVLINENWYQVGDMVDGQARIVAIETSQVEIEWNGNSYTYLPIEASIPDSEQEGRGLARGTSIQTQGGAGMVVINGTQGGTRVSAISGLQDMSQAERERLRNQMVQQFGGRGGMMGGGRGGTMGGGRGGGGRGGRGR